MIKMIFDKLTKIPTVLSTNRVKRSDQTGSVDKSKVAQDAPKVDFFAKGNEGMTPPSVYQDQDDWNVRVFPNKYPILDNHEVIVHSPGADDDLSTLPHEQNVRYLRAILNRVDFYNNNDMEVFIFNNKGGKAGASLLHPHSQLVALKGFPGIIEQEKEEALQYYNEHTNCYWCDLLAEELAAKERIVYENAHFVIMVPKASRWSFEMKLLPKRHNPNFGYIDEVEINDLANVLKYALIAYDNLFDHPDRNFWIHTQRYEPYHWHMGFIPHIKVFGGLELGAGIWVSDRASPEEAAAQLAEKIQDFIKSGK